jgi:hypothetical protein
VQSVVQNMMTGSNCGQHKLQLEEVEVIERSEERSSWRRVSIPVSVARKASTLPSGRRHCCGTHVVKCGFEEGGKKQTPSVKKAKSDQEGEKGEGIVDAQHTYRRVSRRQRGRCVRSLVQIVLEM